MSERTAISEITIGKEIGSTTGVATRGLYIYGEAWSASTEDKIYFTFKTLAFRDRKGQEKLIYVEGDGDLGSGASQSWYVTANAGTGLGKLDTGSFDTGTSYWYYLYAVYNPDTQDIGGVYSLDSKYPSFDNISGYTFYRRISVMRSSTSYFKNMKQFSEKAIYYTPINIVTPDWTDSANTWTYFDISWCTPPIARFGNFVFGTNGRGGGISRESDGYGGCYMQVNNSTTGDNFDNSDLCPAQRYQWASMSIPIFGATNLYYLYVNGDPYISTTGWEDNLSIYY